MRVLLLALAAAAVLPAQQRIEITIELRQDAQWKAMEPAHVFAAGDQLRFRFQSNSDGYLYVVNRGTSGEETMLFPSANAGRDNKVESGKEYVIPSTSGAFRIVGPPGHDVVYWILSPIKLGEMVDYKPLPPPPDPAKVPSNLSPRCDDAILRARGECIDNTAGLKQNKLPNMQARELFFAQKGQQSVVVAPPVSTGNTIEVKAPITYQFRIAHR